ncbi:GntR family transcriptional regulator [Bradyrhizobium prioriisuperbiae]|uniref:GntR family transcriptional regulator n=1 Tax=Bradyrhizobium prioriisuperbiae TaxID=2854389 RepID=UPI0028E2AC8A|nr:GntR family transcriptional regulator [Bradyrhizobium prioritasuperba]
MSSSAVIALSADAAGPRTLTSAVYEQLRRDILSARLSPGQKLHIAHLSKGFGVSLAATREALSRLVADGLVRAADQRGFHVSPVSIADLQDITRTRIDIEGLALRRSIEFGGRDWQAAVEAAFAALLAVPYRDPSDPKIHNEPWLVRHRMFHRTLVSACDSPWLLRFRDTLYEQSERYRQLSIPVDPGLRDVDSEHRQIVDAVLRRDSDAAVAALTVHFSRTEDLVKRRTVSIQEVVQQSE